MCDNNAVFSLSWATPCRELEVKTYKVGGTNVRDIYEVSLYERNVQVENLSSLDAPLLIDLLRRTLPQGILLSVHPHLEEHFEARVIPDPLMQDLKKELGDIVEKKAEQIEAAAVKKKAKEAKRAESLLASLQEED